MEPLSTVEQAISDGCHRVARRRFGENVSLLIEEVAGEFEARLVGALGVAESQSPSARAAKRQEALERLLVTLDEAERPP